ncbi:MAG: leucine-rich repeat domain-containing protein [Bacteroidaceae bacterium]|nr:leucine-rich repeat domain-containing protein [Bacteroidaceae bacterium]
MMTTKKLKSVMVALGVLLSVNANAYDVEVDGIYYNLVKKAKQAEVTSGDSKYKGDVVIPESFSYDGVTYAVTSIGEKAFEYCSDLTSMSIPESVTSIGKEAFRGSSSLTSVNIPNSLTEMDDGAFYGCGITSVSIPGSVSFIASDAFNRCKNLTSVTISDGVTKIYSCAFYGCVNLYSIYIPKTIEDIYKDAFNGCKTLTSVNISSLENWCNISFHEPYNTLLPTTTTYEHISYSANPLIYAHILYLEGNEVTELNIPEGVTSISSGAFYGCSGLTSVTIPNSVTSIGWDAFARCI